MAEVTADHFAEMVVAGDPVVEMVSVPFTFDANDE